MNRPLVTCLGDDLNSFEQAKGLMMELDYSCSCGAHLRITEKQFSKDHCPFCENPIVRPQGFKAVATPISAVQSVADPTPSHAGTNGPNRIAPQPRNARSLLGPAVQLATLGVMALALLVVGLFVAWQVLLAVRDSSGSGSDGAGIAAGVGYRGTNIGEDATGRNEGSGPSNRGSGSEVGSGGSGSDVKPGGSGSGGKGNSGEGSIPKGSVGVPTEFREDFEFFQDGKFGLCKRTVQSFDLGENVRLEMVLIPAGEFLRGAPPEDKSAGSDEVPQRPIRITKPFYMGKFEITRGQFALFVKETGHITDAERQNDEYTWKKNPLFNQQDDHPLILVSETDIDRFLDWLRKKTGKNMQLPSEAEWEYACRAGSQAPWHSGANELHLPEVAMYLHRVIGGHTQPVGTYKANKFGLHDMHGNAWEVCADWYNEEFYKSSPTDDPRGPDKPTDPKKSRVRRGGSWVTSPTTCRSTHRGKVEYALRGYDIGLRVIRRVE